MREENAISLKSLGITNYTFDALCVLQFGMTLFPNVLFTISCRFIAHAHARTPPVLSSFVVASTLSALIHRVLRLYDNGNDFSLAPH